MGSVPPSPTARSLRSSKLAGGGRGGKRVENSQVYIRREEGEGPCCRLGDQIPGTGEGKAGSRATALG